ncbi:MAG: response regulator transcription factor [Elusimicrobia bacterium]|nr:response regulator transcription factor [Elusimicrobiota bacterium]
MKKEVKRILIVEDEADVALVVTKILEGRDVHISTTGSIKETEELLEKEAFDIIIMDRMLPDGDSVQIFKKLKESPALKLLPVLILSGKDRFGEQAEGLDLGADDYMTKPFSPQELRIRVEALLRRAEKFAS